MFERLEQGHLLKKSNASNGPITRRTSFIQAARIWVFFL